MVSPPDAWSPARASAEPEGELAPRAWLFHSNSIRFASAMGRADYRFFANGRYRLSKNLQEVADWLRFLECARPRGSDPRDANLAAAQELTRQRNTVPWIWELNPILKTGCVLSLRVSSPKK